MPANVASLGIFGLVWNLGEFVVSILLAVLSGLCVIAGWVVGAIVLLGLIAFVAIAVVKGMGHWTKPRAAVS